MARSRAAESARSRSKSALIEETTRGIEQFQDILASIEDFSREGFPYRDAARAKAELQLRECVRRIFGERSQEFQTYRGYKLRISTKAETGQSIAAIKQLIHALEDKKLELQGLKPPAPEPPKAAPAPPPLALVPPAATARITMPAQPAPTAPVTLSVAMTTNLGTVPPPPAVPQEPPPQTPPIPPPSPNAVPVATAPVIEPVASLSVQPAQTEHPQAVTPMAPGSEMPDSASTPRPAAPAPSAPPAAAAAAPREGRPPAPTPVETPFKNPLDMRDPLESVRKICQRFHAVTRQLRLRKDYRATLEVEDDYDLQDLFCALLRVEFDEVGIEEWLPPYTEGAPRSAFLLCGGRIAVVVKKTRPGLTTKELVEQVTADSGHYGSRDKCTTLFCFIYDPEGRIGSPKQLETDLTSVSDRYTIDVLVAPK